MNNILVTGTSSGIGKEIVNLLNNHNVISLDRSQFDMDQQGVFDSVQFNDIDMLFNVAGHDLGGKVDFVTHSTNDWYKIINTNLLNTMSLTQNVLKNNKNAVIINITSTNVDQYYPNDLVYSLTKTALSTFTEYLRIEYSEYKNNFKEVRLGLTKTNFVNNRHKNNHIEKIDLYKMFDYLTPTEVASRIIEFAFSDEQLIWIKK